MQKKAKIWISVGVILLVILVPVTIWIADSSKPMDEAFSAMESDNLVEISTDPWITFTPKTQNAPSGLIFYPGGKVEPESYAPLLRKIAEAGYFVVLVPMPLNLAVISPNKASKVIETYASIEHWAIGGHSLGGSMAAKFAYENQNLIDALLLYAAYPVDSNNLSTSDLAVLTIYGSEDGVLSKSIPDTMSLLPSSATIYEIAGGNHAYFGYYGEQKGDGQATITREQQMNITLTQSLLILDQL